MVTIKIYPTGRNGHNNPSLEFSGGVSILNNEVIRIAVHKDLARRFTKLK